MFLGVNVRTTYDRNNYEFYVSKQVGRPGDFQHLMTLVTLFKNIFASISYINLFLIKKT